MCGEIGNHQYKRTVNVRLVTSGTETRVVLNKQLVDVEEIRLSEVLAVGFNGGTSTGVYLDINSPQVNCIAYSNNTVAGNLVLVDVLNPHKVYANNLLAVSQLGTVSEFNVSLKTAAGTPVLFTELFLVLTFVCRKAGVEMAPRDVPQIKGADPRNSFFSN